MSVMPAIVILCTVAAGGCATIGTAVDKQTYVVEGTTRFGGGALTGGMVMAHPDSPMGRPFIVDIRKDGTFTFELPAGIYYLMGRARDEAAGVDMAAYWGGNPLNLFGDMDSGVVLPFFVETGMPESVKGKGISGRILTMGGRPVSGAVAAAYLDAGTGFHGPPYISSLPTDLQGRFNLCAEPGTYYVTARLRPSGGGFTGPLLKGDLAGYYTHNPVTVRHGMGLSLDISLIEVNRPRGEGSLSPGRAIVVEGNVWTETGSPAVGVRVVMHDAPEMLGRPVFVSSPTDSEGRYMLEASKEGTFYLTARSRIGGPPETGELLGYYSGSEDHSLSIEWGDHFRGVDITVREVW